MAAVSSTHAFRVRSRRADFDWRIPLFNLVACSTPISVFGESWNINIYFDADEEWTSLKMTRDKTGGAFSVSVVIKKQDGTEDKMLGNRRLEKDGKVWTLKRFLRWQDLWRRMRDVAPTGMLTLGLTFLELEPEEAQRTEMEVQGTTDNKDASSENRFLKGYSILVKDLKNLLLSKDDHDVIFKVKNVELSGHKFMLAARSPVFAVMFRHDMKDSARKEIQMDDCDPAAFEEFLNYIYTGEVKNISLNKAMGLHYIGHKFEILELEEFCVAFLQNKLSISTLCDVIDFAKRRALDALFEYALNFFHSNTKEIFCSKEWREFGKRNFDVANELYIKAYEAIQN